jgi:predicted MFS family arabinose efflux permease
MRKTAAATDMRAIAVVLSGLLLATATEGPLGAAVAPEPLVIEWKKVINSRGVRV